MLIVAGSTLIALGIVGWIWPPRHSAFAPSATTKNAIGKVSAPSETLSTALIAAGALFLLVGVNGRKFASIKIGGDELAFAQAVSRAAAGKAKQKAASAGLDAEATANAELIAAGDAYAKAMADPLAVDADHIAEQAVTAARPAT